MRSLGTLELPGAQPGGLVHWGLVHAVQGDGGAGGRGWDLVDKSTALLMEAPIIVHHVAQHHAQFTVPVLLQGFHRLVMSSPARVEGLG